MYLFVDLEALKNNFLFEFNVLAVLQILHCESESDKEQKLNESR